MGEVALNTAVRKALPRRDGQSDRPLPPPISGDRS